MHRITDLLFAIFAALMIGFVTVAAPICWGQGGGMINEDYKLLPSDGAENDQFGVSIAIENGLVAIGMDGDDDKGSSSGSAFLFDVSSGAELFKLLATDGDRGDRFGSSIAINNGIVAVGAHGDTDNGHLSGSAYTFNASTGEQIAKLVPNDGVEYDYFGISIAIDNGIVGVGAYKDGDNGRGAGSAYLFDAVTGEQVLKLLPNDGAERDHFGLSIAMGDGLVVVGAPWDGDNADYSGSAYLFDASSGKQIAKFNASDGAVNDQFGWSVAIDNGIIAVGAIWGDDGIGSAYLFDVSTGTQIAKLLSDDRAWLDGFGISIAIDNGVVAVGAYQDDDNGLYSGSAYLFDASNGAQIAKLLPSDGEKFDEFGYAVAIDHGIVTVGAWEDDDIGRNFGSAYVFDANPVLTCLYLTVSDLIAGERANFTLIGGIRGSRGITVYGTKPGHTFVTKYAGYCAGFGIKGVHQGRVIGGFDRTFDANGEMSFKLDIPGNLAGLGLLFQSTERGTCPERCMSNLVEMVVQ